MLAKGNISGISKNGGQSEATTGGGGRVKKLSNQRTVRRGERKIHTNEDKVPAEDLSLHRGVEGRQH